MVGSIIGGGDSETGNEELKYEKHHIGTIGMGKGFLWQI